MNEVQAATVLRTPRGRGRTELDAARILGGVRRQRPTAPTGPAPVPLGRRIETGRSRAERRADLVGV